MLAAESATLTSNADRRSLMCVPPSSWHTYLRGYKKKRDGGDKKIKIVNHNHNAIKIISQAVAQTNKMKYKDKLH
jgi:hypothetical protein